jgi:hypothetical protein
LNPIVKAAVALEPGEKKFILLVGAGVSKDASLPTAWDVMIETARRIKAAEEGTVSDQTKEEIEAWFLSSEYKNQSYPDLISSVYSTSPQQQEFLLKLLDGRETPVELDFLQVRKV